MPPHTNGCLFLRSHCVRSQRIKCGKFAFSATTWRCFVRFFFQGGKAVPEDSPEWKSMRQSMRDLSHITNLPLTFILFHSIFLLCQSLQHTQNKRAFEWLFSTHQFNSMRQTLQSSSTASHPVFFFFVVAASFATVEITCGNLAWVQMHF